MSEAEDLMKRMPTLQPSQFTFYTRPAHRMNASTPDCSTWRARYEELKLDRDAPLFSALADKARAFRLAQGNYHFACALAMDSAVKFAARNEANTDQSTEEHDREARLVVFDLEAKECLAEAQFKDVKREIGWGMIEQRAYDALVKVLTEGLFKDK